MDLPLEVGVPGPEPTPKTAGRHSDMQLLLAVGHAIHRLRSQVVLSIRQWPYGTRATPDPTNRREQQTRTSLQPVDCDLAFVFPRSAFAGRNGRRDPQASSNRRGQTIQVRKCLPTASN